MADTTATERKLKELIRRSDAELRSTLVSDARSIGSLRASCHDQHNKPGWYSARTHEDLAAAGYVVRTEDLLFAVPVDCATWHAAEQRESDGLLYRFFASAAALDLPPCRVARLRVIFGLSPEAIVSTTATSAHADIAIDDVEGERVLTITPHDASAPTRVVLDCPITGIPSKIYPGATDGRLLSVAVTKPELWHE